MSAIDRVAAANAAALARIGAVRPEWCGVQAAGTAVNLPDFTLLHAGPPFRDPCRPSAPILSSAVLCCLYEGWASSEQEAQAMIEDGRVRLRPAQDFGVVAPLAAVISPKTSLVEVRDAAGEGRSWSLLGSGIGPQLRFGSRDPQILERLARREALLAPALHAATRKRAIDLLALAEAGLRGGDDLHAQTTQANAALCEALAAELAQAPEVLQILRDTPLFFLTLWMAACQLMLGAAARDADPDCSLVVALAGNGQQAGMRLAGRPQRWIYTDAGIPQGPRMKPGSAATAPLLGDSGVIDAAGFGAQAWGLARAVAEPMRDWLADPAAGQARWMAGSHPRFAELGLRTGLDARLAAEDPAPPSIAIAMLDAAGVEGLLGRGVHTLDSSFFAAAVAPVRPIDDPQALAELEAAFDRYERALTGNTVAVLDELFWNDARTVRYGAKENLQGYEAIRQFRAGRSPLNLARTVVERSVTVFGTDFGAASIVFERDGEPRPGRQTQTWARLDGRWQVVAAHVSWMDI